MNETLCLNNTRLHSSLNLFRSLRLCACREAVTFFHLSSSSVRPVGLAAVWPVSQAEAPATCQISSRFPPLDHSQPEKRTCSESETTCTPHRNFCIVVHMLNLDSHLAIWTLMETVHSASQSTLRSHQTSRLPPEVLETKNTRTGVIGPTCPCGVEGTAMCVGDKIFTDRR